MAVVAGRNRTNRPFFFTGVDGGRVEFPSHGEGIGELDDAELRKFEACVESGQIERVDGEPTPQEPSPQEPSPQVSDDSEDSPQPKPKRGRPRKEK